MSFPSNLLYTQDHEWISVKGQTALIGVTQFAVEQLGDIVHLDLPKVGAKFDIGSSFGTIESTKTVSDLYMPTSGTVTKVNETLKSNLEELQKDAYEKNFLVEVTLSGGIDKSKLMTSDQYQKFVEENS
jgi:glycine cleavage system H protein